MRPFLRLLVPTALVTCVAVFAPETPGSREVADQDPAIEAHPAADPADVATLDALVTSLYDVISGPAGQKRDFDRLRSLFHPEAKMVPIGPERGREGVFPSLIAVDGYIERAGDSLERSGFYEIETSRRVERFGHLAQVFSAYEIKQDLEAEKPLLRGVNGITCVFSEGRWWVLQIAWEQETTAGEWPDRYLPDAAADTPLEPASFEIEEDRDR